MTNETHPLKVFICHAHDDKLKARELYIYLKRRGIQPWLDTEDLLPGQARQMEIPQTIKTSDAIIICLSKESVDKEGYVQKEIRFALDKALEIPGGRIFLIPAKLEECDVPHSLSGYNWVDLFDERGYAKLVKSLKLRAEQLKRKKVETLDAEELYNHVPKAEKQYWLRNLKPEYIFAIIVAAATILAALIDISSQFFKPVPVLTTTETATIVMSQSPTATYTVLPPSKTPEPSLILTQVTITHIAMVSPTITLTITKTITPTPVTISDLNMTMILIPAGVFQKKDGQKYVPDFYIDQHEVTNLQYEQCVKEGACTTPFPAENKDYSDVQHYGIKGYEYHPVAITSWNMAENYCKWRGLKTGNLTRLPYDYEWEKAARGLLINQPYPWGSALPVCTKGEENGANFSECGLRDALPVMSFAPNGYGIFDMAGNVAEWINYFKKTPSGDERMMRGGSWIDSAYGIRVDSAGLPVLDIPGRSFLNIGFRCASSVP